MAGEMKSDRSFCVFLEFISGCGKLNELAGHSSFYCDEVPPSLSAIPGKSTLFFFLVCYLYLFSCLVVNNIISWHTFRSQNIPVIMTLQTLTLYAKDVFFCLFSFQFTVCHFSVKCSNWKLRSEEQETLFNAYLKTYVSEKSVGPTFRDGTFKWQLITPKWCTISNE